MPSPTQPKTSTRRCGAVWAALALWTVLPHLAVRADIFTLQDDGQIRGELVNKDQKPRKNYVVKTASGGQVTLDAAQVKSVKKQSAAELQYDKIRSKYGDTSEAQWEIAQWCREHKLTKQRRVHLERVIELDPDHAEARHALGFSHIQGRWVTQEKLMTENGYIKDKKTGKWVLPQEAELLEQDRKEKLAQTEWNNRVKRWNAWLHTDKAAQAEANIRAINDPFAARPLVKFLEVDQGRDTRMMYIDTLGRLNAPYGMDALVRLSIMDPDEEIRLACLDQVVTNKYKPALGKYVQALKSKDNPIVNRAAVCLGQLKDPNAVGPLIDSLITTHTYQIQHGTPGGTSATFGKGANTGMGGLSTGSSVETVRQVVENRAVLQALVDLSGGTSFNFDVASWRTWFASQKKPQSIGARRD